ncbi:hypothetical protein CTAYLR_006505 [Chrysophaeum taylorii]|uniref:STAS domain-containing protein n=1 Tax=Chrysophaeum taylorii TaxID=2483200 RepID=A0AAD7ULD8_9STRA|nr:hypothetical protein CTAYLR_006505 [Chrysophaeum taylorii]
MGEAPEARTESPFLTEELLGDENFSSNGSESDGERIPLRWRPSASSSSSPSQEEASPSLAAWRVKALALVQNIPEECFCGLEVKEHWKLDILAGLTVGIVLVPQGMAYALLANLNPVYGLYCGVMPLVTYACLGDSRFLAIGPFALVSLLSADAASAACDAAGDACVAAPDSACFVSATLTLSLTVGVAQLILAASGVAEVVASLLADSVMDGFTTAAACTIATSQLSHLVGFSEDQKSRSMERAATLVPGLKVSAVLQQWLAVLLSTDAIDWSAVSVGAVSFAALLALKKLKQRKLLHPYTPEQLLVILLATAVSALGNRFAPCVGHLPSGFPRFDPTPWRDLYATGNAPLATTLAIAKGSLTLAVIVYVLSLAIVRSLAAKAGAKDSARPRRELAALGASNCVGAFFGSYVAAGSLSRSALATDAGAATPRHNLVAALVVAGTLVALTPLFEPTPKAVLSSVVFVSLLSLFDFGETARLWHRGHREDAALWITTFLATLALGVEPGLAIGVLLSIARLVRDAARPPVAQLGRIEGHPTVYRDLKRRKRAPQLPAAEIPGVAVVRYGAAVTFASRAHFARALKLYLDQDRHVHAVVLDCSSVTSIDSSGEKTLREIIHDFKDARITLLFACARSTLRDVLANAHVLQTELIPASTIFVSLHDAVSFAEFHLVPYEEDRLAAASRDSSSTPPLANVTELVPLATSTVHTDDDPESPALFHVHE